MRFTAVTHAARHLLLFILLFSAAQSQGAQLVINGAAKYSQLTRDYYLGALWLPEKSSSTEYILSSATAKRMQIIVLAERWSARKWSRQWQSNISINNDYLHMPEEVQQGLIHFTRLLREDLRAGDEIRIEYRPGGNTRIMLNRELAEESPGPALFNALLNTWIGKLPPSREFRRDILGEGSAADQQQYASRLHNHPLPGHRLNLFSGWRAAEQAALRAQEQARMEEEQQRLAAEQQRQQQAQEARAAQLAAAKAAAEQKARDEAARKAHIAAEQEVSAREAAHKQAQQQAAETQAKQLVGKTSNALGERKTAATLAQEQSCYLQLLQWRLQRAAQAEVKYPGWAKQFREEGRAHIDFNFSRDGQLSAITVRDDRVADLLTAELERAAKEVAAKVEVPAELAGDGWPLSLYYLFSLQQTAQPTLTMPGPPDSIKSGPLSEEQQQQLTARYQQQQTQTITAAIEYPAAARILKKQGTVVAEVQINTDGNLISTDVIRPSKHRELNDALLKAVNSSAPFPPLPAGISDNAITLEVAYEFKL